MQNLTEWVPHLVLASFFTMLFLDPSCFKSLQSTDLGLVRVGSNVVDSLVWIRLSKAHIGWGLNFIERLLLGCNTERPCIEKAPIISVDV